MGLDAMWQQCVYTVSPDVGLAELRDPACTRSLFLGVVIVIVSAWVLYKTEVRSK